MIDIPKCPVPNGSIKGGADLKKQSNKIAYISAQVPWGRGETFIIEEMLAIKKLGTEIVIIPRSPTKEIFHPEAQTLLENSIWLPLINLKMMVNFFISFLTKPRLWKVLSSIICHSRTWRNLAKNLAVLPKGVYITDLLKEKGVKHIHAHWSSTTSTLAYIFSQLTGIPWSFTAHSEMILQNNMIKEKVKTASFVRAISKRRCEDLLRIAGQSYQDKVFVLHMGVSVPPYDIVVSKTIRQSKRNIIGCMAMLDIIKGHRYLINACYILKQQGFNYKCLIIGEGKERRELEALVNSLKLNTEVELVGQLSHSKVINILSEDKIDVLVLPSIALPLKKRAEGIPVALMEAMADGIPVISTATGSIPELLGGNSGILVPEKNPEALAEAIKKVLTDHKLREKLIRQGYEKVSTEFNIKLIAQNLVKYFEGENSK